MKYVAPILLIISLLQFTAPNGYPIFFNRDEIVAISEPATCGGAYNAGSGARIMTTMGSFCVRESVEQAVSKFIVEPAK